MAGAALNGLYRLHGPLRPVPRTWLEDHVEVVAPRLLGTIVARREADGSWTMVRLVEVEAYREDDPASHSFRGLRPRTRSMFGPPGLTYVYFTYGMHHCVNLSCEPEGVGAAVLLRAAVLLCGEPAVRARRGDDVPARELLRGPARLARALGLDRSWDGVDTLAADGPLRLLRDRWRPPAAHITRGPRVGVREASDRPWRFYLVGVPEVSRYVRHPRARRQSG